MLSRNRFSFEFAVVHILTAKELSQGFNYFSIVSFVDKRLHSPGMKGNALENQFPMLCEGTRRQRGDLALTLLLHCRDDTSRVRQIMDVLLDKNRYDLPSVTGTTKDKKKVERSDSQENKSEGSETSSNGVVRTRANLGVPNRRGR